MPILSRSFQEKTVLNHNVEVRRRKALKRAYNDYLGIAAVFAGGKTLKIDGKFHEWTRTRGCPGYDKIMKALNWGVKAGLVRFVNSFTYEIDVDRIPVEFRSQLPTEGAVAPAPASGGVRLPSSVKASAAPKTKFTLPPIAQVLDHVSVHFGVSVDEITGPSQVRHVTRPRLVAYYLGHVHLGIGQRVVGDYIGRRKQSAVSLGIKKLKQDMRVDQRLHAKVETIREKFKE